MAGVDVVITDDDWIEFIISFFGVIVDPKWIKHVSTNWNPVLKASSCGCSYRIRHGPVYCEIYMDMLISRIGDS